MTDASRRTQLGPSLPLPGTQAAKQCFIVWTCASLLLGSACRPSVVVDCREYEGALRSLSPPVKLLDAGVATLGSRSTDWLIGIEESNSTKVVSLDRGSRASIELPQSDLARPLSLFGLESRALMLSGSALSVIAADSSVTNILQPTDHTERFWIATFGDSFSLINAGRVGKPTVLDFSQGNLEFSVALEGQAGPESFSSIARNESMTCVVEISNTSRRDELHCRGLDADFRIVPDVAPLPSRSERRTLAMTPTRVLWLATDGRLHAAELAEGGHQSPIELGGQLGSVMSSVCGALVSRTEAGEVRLTYVGDSVFDLLTGPTVESRITGRELTYVRDGAAFVHTF